MTQIGSIIFLQLAYLNKILEKNNVLKLEFLDYM